MANPFDNPSKPPPRIGFGRLLLAALLAFAIIQYGFIERVVGRFLALHNTVRPLAGQAWTAGIEKELAAGRSETPDLAAGVRGDFAQWLLRAQRGRPATLPLARFAAMWNNTPEFLREEVFPDDKWQSLMLSSAVDRVRPNGTRRGVELSFLTASNRQTARIMLNREWVNRAMMHGQTVSDSITKVNMELRLFDARDLDNKFAMLSPGDRRAVWRAVERDVLLHRPLSRYGVAPLDDKFGLLWLETLAPNISSTSYLIPASAAAVLSLPE